MKVLKIHNFYLSSNPSGENTTVNQETRFLEGAGVQLFPYYRHSDEIAQLPLRERIALAWRPIHSRSDIARIRKILRTRRPDLVHLHNPYPLISPGVVRAAHDFNVPVVQTIHNHRHVCAAATLFRDGHECTDCVGRSYPWPAIVHRCYRDSRPQSVVLATALAVHRNTFRSIEHFIAPSAHMSTAVEAIGVPKQRVTVKPTAVDDPGPPEVAAGDGVVFVGRLTAEKGVETLLEAWRHVQHVHPAETLTIVGDGPLRSLVSDSNVPNVVYTGPQPHDEALMQIRKARVLVMPSLWPETFGRAAVEALAVGRPVVATDLGGLDDIVTPDVGWLCEPNVQSLAQTLSTALATDTTDMGVVARRRYEQHYTPDVVHKQLLSIFENVIAAGCLAR